MRRKTKKKKRQMAEMYNELKRRRSGMGGTLSGRNTGFSMGREAFLNVRKDSGIELGLQENSVSLIKK